MDVLDLLLVAILLVGGIVCVIFGARMLLRGDAVTAEEAVKWRRGVRKQGFDASPDMNPAITDILVRAWRTWQGWCLLCVGISGMLAGVGIAIFLMLSGGGLDDDMTVMLFLGAALYPGVLVGMIVGLARIPREPGATGYGEPFPRSWRLSRLPLAAWYPAAVLVVNVIFMTILVLRFAPGLNSAALAHAFTLFGMWSVPVVPIILLAIVVSMLLVKRWILALAPLHLPQDADVRQQADGRLRKLALGMIYIIALYATWLATFAQFSVLTSGIYPDNPFIIAGLNDWDFFYYAPLIVGYPIAMMALLFSDFIPYRRRGMGPNGRGEVQATQPQP